MAQHSSVLHCRAVLCSAHRSRGLTANNITACGVTGAALCEGRAHSFQPRWKCKEMAQPLSKWVFTCWLSPLSYLTPLQPRAALFGFLNVFLALFGVL